MKKHRLVAMALAGLAGLSVTASAQISVVSDTLQVSAKVVTACNIDSTTGLDFPYTGPSTTSFASGDVTVTCTPNVRYNIALDAGGNPDPATGVRRVTDGTNFISYLLRRPGTLGVDTEWGDSDFDNTYPAGSSVFDFGNGAAQPHAVPGEMTFATDPSGVYVDTVVVSVYF